MKNSTIRYLALVPILIVLWLTYYFYTDIPVQDYWDFLVGRYLCSDSWRSRLSYYAQPFVDHLHVFPKMEIDALIALTGNRHYRLEMALGFLGRLITLGLVGRLLRRSLLTSTQQMAAWLAAAFLIFWPILQAVFLWHNDATLFAWCFSAALLAFVALQTFWGRWRGLALAATACAVSSYSHGSGVPLWLAIGTILLPSREWTTGQKATWWLLAGLAVGAVLLSLPPREALGFPPLTGGLRAPLRIVTFFFKCLTPPFRLFQAWLLPGWHYAQALVGAGMTAFYIWPLIVLFRQRRLFTRAAFPWLGLLVWAMGIAGTAALARGTFEGIPRPAYFTSTLFAAVGAVPLWLMAYPKALLQGGPPAIGLLRAAAVAGLGIIYLVGCRDGIAAARTHARRAERGIQSLRYYPAIDHHEFFLYPLRDLDRFLNQTLPFLIEHGATPSYVDPTPFTLPVDTTFSIAEQNNIAVQSILPNGVTFTTTGPHPSITLRPSRTIRKDHVVSFTTTTSAPADLRFIWYDGSSWNEADALTIARRALLSTLNWGNFPEAEPTYRLRPVEAVRLEPIINTGL